MDRAIVPLRQLLLLLGDVAVFFAALAIAVWIRFPGDATRIPFADHLVPFSFVFFLWLLIFAVSGLYNITLGRNRMLLMRVLFTALFFSAGVAIAFFYLTPSVSIAPKTTLVLNLAVTTLLLVAWRLLYNHLLVSNTFRSRLLFIGLNDEARELIAELFAHPHYGLDVAATITLDGSELPNVAAQHTLKDLPAFLQDAHIDTVVLVTSLHTAPELAQQLYESIFLKVRVTDIANIYEQITRRVPVSTISHVWFLENLREAAKGVYETTKRVSDILGALVIGAATILLTPLIAAAIWLGDRGPVFFQQERLGRDGKKFSIYKFRTMIVDAEKNGEQFAEKGDVRVTRIGRILRMTRLDELPQCWNVLIGDMSFIGPRPERPTFAAALTADMPYYAMRLLVRPGLTGWAQVNYSYYATPSEHRLKLQYDLYYIKNRSVVLDLMILIKTLNTILRAAGQ
ncbi:sugar transferase [Patescibacteria group bacterium]|nr:sugar transferase [Patescibacteria group bacterium]